MDTRHRKKDTGNIRQSNVTRICLSVSCVQCYTCLSFCVLFSNVTRICLSVSCVQCFSYLSFCIFCPMLPVSVYMCLVSNVTRICLSVSCVHTERKTCVTLDTRHRKIDTCNIGHKTQKDRHG
jgi:hypothetical protein